MVYKKLVEIISGRLAKVTFVRNVNPGFVPWKH